MLLTLVYAVVAALALPGTLAASRHPAPPGADQAQAAQAEPLGAGEPESDTTTEPEQSTAESAGGEPAGATPAPVAGAPTVNQQPATQAAPEAEQPPAPPSPDGEPAAEEQAVDAVAAVEARAARELETAHKRLLNTHLEKELKSVRVLREMAR